MPNSLIFFWRLIGASLAKCNITDSGGPIHLEQGRHVTCQFLSRW
jgi:hypothetical protein